jgi:hypothetical protein
VLGAVGARLRDAAAAQRISECIAITGTHSRCAIEKPKFPLCTYGSLVKVEDSYHRS